ncbi:cytochrome c oxidase assembly protein [Alkalihalobacillus trypoxylicola]|uniref:Cytochrome c oxidase assembly protein n=1 Tax=Alkalihalobacillus trypoxylicola TaxID=519424 RepID=A0A161Q6G3_9BACI|nr:cytochrome c oxidase assembly protein [Alkalihalobacillus trypoxylicola]KYG31918.1 hypothetical protein AZF04_03840 [Alkalihalobacillus trypoxylicola]
MNHMPNNIPHIPSILVSCLLGFLLFGYILAVLITNKRNKKWPRYRLLCWVIGIFLVLFSFVGPLAERAHQSFTYHMLAHLFLGMLAPLLWVLAAPVTLLLKTIKVSTARRIMKIFQSKLARLITHPMYATIINIGGLWLLYTTSLYHYIHESMMLYHLIHTHTFLVGYLFTSSLLYIEPIYHRVSFKTRAIFLILAIAGHGILSKYLYAHSLKGISVIDSEKGSMLMYYGGDTIDMFIIIIFCYQWYKAVRPRHPLHKSNQNIFM